MIYVSAYIKNDSEELLCTDKPIIINSAGYCHCIDKHLNTTYRKEGREDYQILYVAKGKAYFEMKGKEVLIEEGEIVIYKPYEEQNYRYDLNDKSNIYWIHFSGNNVEKLLNNIELASDMVYNIGFKEKYIKLWEDIIMEIQSNRLYYNEIINGYLTELLVCMARGVYEYKNNLSKTHEIIQKAISDMHNTQNNSMNVKLYAKNYNMSVCWFIKNFKEITGMTPNQYISRVKVNKAKELLIETGFNITEVAYMLGFESPFYFSKVFKKITGVPPKEWKTTSKIKNSR